MLFHKQLMYLKMKKAGTGKDGAGWQGFDLAKYGIRKILFSDFMCKCQPLSVFRNNYLKKVNSVCINKKQTENRARPLGEGERNFDDTRESLRVHFAA
jgi:hypothetical protein